MAIDQCVSVLPEVEKFHVDQNPFKSNCRMKTLTRSMLPGKRFTLDVETFHLNHMSW